MVGNHHSIIITYHEIPHLKGSPYVYDISHLQMLECQNTNLRKSSELRLNFEINKID